MHGMELSVHGMELSVHGMQLSMHGIELSMHGTEHPVHGMRHPVTASNFWMSPFHPFAELRSAGDQDGGALTVGSGTMNV